MTTPPPRRGRPRVSSREALEEVAFELLLRDGYEATTIQAIMSAGGVGRTTFFRYFGSKGGIVWGEFDRAVERLGSCLAAADGMPVLPAIVGAVVESTRLSREAAPETWLDRFRVLDRDPALAGETAEHWRVWALAVSEFVARECGIAPDSVVASSIGNAIQGAYVSVLRQWVSSATPADVDIDDLANQLWPLASALEHLLPHDRRR